MFILRQIRIGLTSLLSIGIHKARRTTQLPPVFGWETLLSFTLLFATAPLIGIAAAGLEFLAGSIASARIAFRYGNWCLSRPFNMGLRVWALCATIALIIAWWCFAKFGRNAVATLSGAAANMTEGWIVKFALVAAIVLRSFAPGRSLVKWHLVRQSLRQSSS